MLPAEPLEPAGLAAPAGRRRIAMTSYYLPSGSKIGAGFQAHELAQALSDRGHEVVMFSPCPRPDDARYEHRQLPMAGSLRTFRWAFAIRGLDLTDFDVFHAHGDDYWLMGRDRPAHARTMHGSCLAEAIHISGAKERLRMGLLGLGEVLATRVADDTVCISENTRHWFPWLHDVIPCGVDLTRFHAGDSRAPDPTILFVGTYERRKRGRLLMDVFERDVRPALPDARLWMVCSDAPAAPGVEVLGRLDDAALAERYRQAWVFCLPSTYEGFGVPYLEAMASGTPVVATPNVGAKEVLRDGRDGLLVDDDELGAELVALLGEASRRDALGAAGAARARDFAWPLVAARYEAIYEGLLAAPRRPRRASRPR